MFTYPSLVVLIWITQSRCCLLYQLVFSLQLVNKPSSGHMLRPGDYPTPYHISPLRFSTHFPEPVFAMMTAKW